jgi:NAD-dependent SIR2 family protein deacetylase
MQTIEEAISEIKSANYLLITAGAGMGVDSNLPDFRGKEGFWRAYPYAKANNLAFEELANPIWFEQNPKVAWAFYGHRLNLYRETKPHDGFRMLLEIAKSKEDYFVLTSNIDGHFQKAGFREDKIDEIHGSIEYLQCSTSCSNNIWSAKEIKIDIDLEKFEAKEPLPKCKRCKSIARPNILMFSDFGYIDSREREQRERFAHFLQKIGDKKLAIIEIGAGLFVPTIRVASSDIAKEFNTKLIRINPIDFKGDSNTISIKLGAKEAIRYLYKEAI